MKRFFEKFWPIFCLVVLLTSIGICGYYAYMEHGLAMFVIGVIIGIILAPIVHEGGHILAAKSVNMECVYAKLFCVRIRLVGNRKKWEWASPFSEDQTQVIPKSAENMKKRVLFYTISGLLFGGVLLALLLVLSIAIVSFRYVFIGMMLYNAYLFLLNVLPLEYSIGKTDMLIYKGIQNGADAERTMLSAMTIDGYLYEGKRFSEIDEDLYFKTPQLCEEEPLFAMMLDLRYRYWLDVDDIEQAAMCLNRMATLQDYMTKEDLQAVAAELVYMHAITNNLESAMQNFNICEEFLKAETATSKRILFAYYAILGDREKSEQYRKQGLELCEKERIKGVALLEKTLLEYR